MGCRGDQARRACATSQESILSRIVRSAAARRDADTIWDYIAEDDPIAANAFIDRINERLQILSEHPLIGSDRSITRPGLRSISVGNYTIFYRAIPDGIRVVRILHASRDLSRVFPNR